MVKGSSLLFPFNWESLLEIERGMQEGNTGMLFPNESLLGNGLADVLLSLSEQGKREVGERSHCGAAGQDV